MNNITKVIDFLVNPFLVAIVYVIFLSAITNSELPFYIITFMYIIWMLANKKNISILHWCLLVVLFLPLVPKILYFLLLIPYLLKVDGFLKSSSLIEAQLFRFIKDILKGIYFAAIHLFLIIWLSNFVTADIVKGLFIIIGFFICATFIRFWLQISFSLCYVSILDKTKFYLELSKILGLKKTTVLVFHVLAIILSLLLFILIFASIYHYWFTAFYNIKVSYFDLVYFTFCVYYSIPILSESLVYLLTVINNDTVLRIFQITHIITGKVVDLTILGFIIVSLTEKLKEWMSVNDK